MFLNVRIARSMNTLLLCAKLKVQGVSSTIDLIRLNTIGILLGAIRPTLKSTHLG